MRLALLTLALLLTACGFQLRGAEGIAAVRPDPALAPEVLEGLRQGGLRFRADAPWTLIVPQWRLERDVVAVDAAGRPATYRLRLTLDYRLRRGHETREGRLILERDFRSPPDQPLARSAQAAPLEAELWREAAQRLSQRLRP